MNAYAQLKQALSHTHAHTHLLGLKLQFTPDAKTSVSMVKTLAAWVVDMLKVKKSKVCYNSEDYII